MDPAAGSAIRDREATDGPIEKARTTAFRRLAAEHLPTSYRLARAIVGDVGHAEDAVQDAFVQAWRQWSTLRDPSRFEAWFHRILVNTCRNQLRSRAVRRVEDISSELGLASPSDDIAAALERDHLNQALVRLDPDHRVVVAMRYGADLTIDQIAQRLAVPAGTVKSRLHHALRRLEHELGPDAGEDSR